MSVRRKIKHIHRQYPFDIIYARGLWLEADLGIRIGRLLNLPVVGAGIGSDVNVRPNLGRAFFRYFKRIAVNLDAVMATGSGVAQKLADIKVGEVTVMGGVVDLEEFYPIENKKQVRNELGLPKDKIIFLFAGHIIESKGVYELVDAYEQVIKKYPNSQLYFCGQGAEFCKLKEKIKKLDLTENIKMVGNVVPDLMPQWMQASDLFVLPSYREGMPNCVMEAMACGLPIVATSVGGLPETIGGNHGVILVNPQNIEELKKALLRVLGDEQLRQEMALAVRKKAEVSFGIIKNSRKVIDCLEQTIKNKM